MTVVITTTVRPSNNGIRIQINRYNDNGDDVGMTRTEYPTDREMAKAVVLAHCKAYRKSKRVHVKWEI